MVIGGVVFFWHLYQFLKNLAVGIPTARLALEVYTLDCLSIAKILGGIHFPSFSISAKFRVSFIFWIFLGSNISMILENRIKSSVLELPKNDSITCFRLDNLKQSKYWFISLLPLILRKCASISAWFPLFAACSKLLRRLFFCDFQITKTMIDATVKKADIAIVFIGFASSKGYFFQKLKRTLISIFLQKSRCF